MKLLELYKAILKTANLVTTEDGYVSMQLGDDTRPALIKGKQMVLPTDAHQNNPDKSKIILFHPLSENILRGESDILEKFRSLLNIRMNSIFGLLSADLLNIAASPSLHSTLTPDQTEFLSVVKNADEKTLTVLGHLMEKMPANQTQKSFVSIYLKKGGLLHGKKHARLGVVNFPLYDELVKSKTECYGVKMRVKDRETLMQLMEYMIPNIDVTEAYNRASDSTVAPCLDALMKSILAIAAPFNDLLDLFKNKIEDAESLVTDSSWVETFENLEVMIPEIRRVPMQAGNEGSNLVASPVAPLPSANTFNQLPLVVMPPPVNPYHAPSVPSWQQPNQFQQPPQQQQYAPPQPVVTERGGLDFDSLLRSNPVLARQASTAMGYPQQQLQPQQQMPRWAQQQNGYPQQQQPMNQWGQQQPQPQWGQPQPWGQQQPQYNQGYSPSI